MLEERHAGRQTCRQVYRQTAGAILTDRHADREICRQTDMQADTQTDRKGLHGQTDKQTHRHVYRQTTGLYGQTHRQAGRLAAIYTDHG